MRIGLRHIQRGRDEILAVAGIANHAVFELHLFHQGVAQTHRDRSLDLTDYRGLEVIPKKGSVLGHDGSDPVKTPYDDCVLIMPSRRLAGSLAGLILAGSYFITTFARINPSLNGLAQWSPLTYYQGGSALEIAAEGIGAR